MMSNDSPKIDLPSLKLERVIKASPDRKSQEEDNLVCVASSKSFLNGSLRNTAQNQGGPAENFQCKNSDLVLETDIIQYPISIFF